MWHRHLQNAKQQNQNFQYVLNKAGVSSSKNKIAKKVRTFGLPTPVAARTIYLPISIEDHAKDCNRSVWEMLTKLWMNPFKSIISFSKRRSTSRTFPKYYIGKLFASTPTASESSSSTAPLLFLNLRSSRKNHRQPGIESCADISRYPCGVLSNWTRSSRKVEN